MSTPPLFFVEHLPPGEQVRLTGDEGRHAARVRRVGVGEAVRVADGLGGLADCVVDQVEGAEVVLRVLGRAAVPVPDPFLLVVQALPKGERAELAVELLTELGVDEIVPWQASRSVVQWRDERGARALERWRRTAREAAKQSRRPRVPAVADVADTAAVAALLAGSAGFVLHEQADAPLVTAELPATGRIVVVVGPEGGIAEDELAAFAAAGARPVRLGEPVLRTSTAGAAALAVLSTRSGRWSTPLGSIS